MAKRCKAATATEKTLLSREVTDLFEREWAARTRLTELLRHDTRLSMKTQGVLALVVLLGVLGCESTPHYDRTKVVVIGTTYPKKAYGTVKLFQDKAEVPGQYDVIALMSVEGNAGDEAAFIKAFLYRAADLGGDAIIFYRGNVVGGQTGIGAGGNGGFGLITTPSQDAA